MTTARIPQTNMEPADSSLADGTNALQPGQTPGIEVTVQGESAAAGGSGGLRQKLVKRIHALSSDVRSRNDYQKLKQKIYAEGGKWRAPNGIVYGVTREGWVYQYLAEYKEGGAQTTIVALDAVPPFVAVVHTDLQSVDPKKREAILKELEGMVRQRKPPSVKPPKPVEPEIIVIVEKDWLSKITLARWGTIEWHRHLKPTEITLASRAAKGVKFDEDLIYPGDTFEVISTGGAATGSP